MGIVSDAENELRAAGYYDANGDYGGKLATAVIEILKVFAAQGHSGMSASIVTDLVTRLMRRELLTPLSGADEEWVDVSSYGDNTPMWQNKRCPNVFKDDHCAYDIDRIVFEREDGTRFTNSSSRVKVVFPYMPKTDIVKAPIDPA